MKYFLKSLVASTAPIYVSLVTKVVLGPYSCVAQRKRLCVREVPIQRRAFERDAFERESFQREALQR